MRTNVLVLGAGGNISQGILKALNHSALKIRIYVACVDPLSVGFYIDHNSGTMISPMAQDPEFMDWLIKILLDYQIDIVFSGGEEILEVLSQHTAYIHDRTGAICVVSPYDIFRIGRDKLLTCQWLEENGLPHPDYTANDFNGIYDLWKRKGPPFIVKPRIGRGSVGVRKVDSIYEIRYPNDLEIVQQYLGSEDEEYTVGTFSTKYGVLKNAIVYRRKLRDGTTYVAEAGEFPEVKEVASEIVRKLKPVGPCNIQMRMHEGAPTPFEINIRYSSSTPMRARMGFNDVAAAIKHFIYEDDGSLGLVPVTTGYGLRYLNEVYIKDIDKRPGRVESWGMK